MATNFIAVQCFQCSTMQVKQQRKSGNKWTCAVCNEKQSVQKVFARAPMAKDVRKFVQSFNMSRKYAEEQAEVDELLDGGIVNDGKKKLDCSERRKRRYDWSAYLDPEEDRNHSGRENERELESDFTDGKIVTELPEVRNRKSSSTSRSSWSDGGEGDGFYKPVFSKRKHIAMNLSSQDEIRNWESPSAIHASKWSKGEDEQIFSKAKNVSAPFQNKKMRKNSHKVGDEIQNWELPSDTEFEAKLSKGMSKDDENARTKTCILAKVGGPSKWSEYISEEDNYGGRNGGNMATEQDVDFFKLMITDEIIEDDIHPDFK